MRRDLCTEASTRPMSERGAYRKLQTAIHVIAQDCGKLQKQLQGIFVLQRCSLGA